ncbi:hypothetical protein VCSRO62_0159 [Vibrio cholerae]|uniref:hypothetical protein n=1 Tax=Vibrio TaxID=662 RepID=UPI000DE42F70|nr:MULTISPECIES: hypothetical protein [Vibrio]RBM64321.1 hypothetical protein DLR71_04975 [Vibrio paracholerae]TXY16322.1 hypothetical protein FXE97_05380 [Vibrio cholerae]GHX29457.1 hypothetical protein VCSRO62_0159 [Vibrio cholerae]GHY08249.1 hypothetical protein VCSRO112_1893 [Vibrio cholerae]
MNFTKKTFLQKTLIICPILLTPQLVQADSLIKNYTFAERTQTYGVESVGYPQVCIRVNMPDQRVDMQGIFDEISTMYHPTMLLPEATKLAASGKLGHVWTIFFDSPDSWKSWSFRFPGNPTANALHTNNWYDGPERKFNYQYCVSTKDKPTDSEYIVANYVEPLLEESREIAKTIYPNFDFVGGVYTPATPCVWFATKLFNKVTGKNIPFEQKFDWNKIAEIINEPNYANLKTVPDAGVVAEALSKKIKYSAKAGNLDAVFTHDKKYVLFQNNQYVDTRDIEMNSFGGKQLSAFFENYKTALNDGSKLVLLDYQGNISIFDTATKSFIFENYPFKEVFKNVDFDPKMVMSSMPIYQGMPYYSKNYNQHLLFLENGDIYLLNTTTMKLYKNHFFEQNAPHLLPYAKRILGTQKFNDESVYVFLTERKYIEVRINDFSIVDGEKPIEQNPMLGKHFKLH